MSGNGFRPSRGYSGKDALRDWRGVFGGNNRGGGGRPGGGNGGGGNGGNNGGGGRPGGGRPGRDGNYYGGPIWGPGYYGPGWGWGGFGGFGGLGWGGYGSSFGGPFYDPFYQPYMWQNDPDRRDRDGEDRGEGNITVDPSPRETEVFVNGVSYGRGRVRLSLPVGEWQVELRAPGHVPQVVPIRVEQGVRYNVKRRLEKDRSAGRDGRKLKEEDLGDGRER